MRRCFSWTLAGVLFGIASIAYAEDAVPSPTSAADSTTILLDLFRSGGLPAVIGGLGWWLGRGGGIPVTMTVSPGAPVPVVVQLADEDRRLLRAFVRRFDPTGDYPSQDRPRDIP
jgi:hypothetical protein